MVMPRPRAQVIRRSRLLPAVVVIGLLGAILASCRVPGAALSGRLTLDGTTAPAAGVTVTVFAAADEIVVAETVANADGIYWFFPDVLPEGTYRVRFGATEWWDGAAHWASATDVVVTAGDTQVVNAAVPGGGPKSTWYEAGFFIDWAGVGMVSELVEEMGAGGMHAVGPWRPFKESTGPADFRNRLEADVGLRAKLELARTHGSPVIVQLEMMPSWITSAPGNWSLPCADQPLWPTSVTRAPAADKWDEWETIVEEAVRYLTVTLGHDDLWFQLWEEPDGPCFWTDTEANYLKLYEHTARAVKRANPAARIGGPGSENPAGTIEPSTRPLVRALIEHAAGTGTPLDFVSYHSFGFAPHRAQLVAEEVGGWLDAAGFTEAPILISSYNPLESATSPYWEPPGTPSPSGRTFEYDTEIGAAYVPAFSFALAESGRRGYHTLFQLDDFDGGREFESDNGWGSRTPEERNGIRKAMYQGMRLLSQVPDTLVATTVEDPRAGSDGALGPLGALAGVEGGEVSLLVWSYVAGPGQEANAVVIADGHPAGLATWSLGAVAAYFGDQAPVASVSTDPQEQATLAKAKRVFFRQRELVNVSRSVRICGDGLRAPTAVHVVDATHNNSYAAWRTGGVSAAITAGQLTPSPQLLAADGNCWRIVVAPYAVVSVRFTTTSIPPQIVDRATS
jgi:hypothetical protein